MTLEPGAIFSVQKAEIGTPILNRLSFILSNINVKKANKGRTKLGNIVYVGVYIL